MRWTISPGGRDALAGAEGLSAVLKRRHADLPVRLASAGVMLATLAAALWAGGIWLDLFVGAVALATFAEFVPLAVKGFATPAARMAWLVFGAVYIGLAGFIMVRLPMPMLAGIIGVVVFVDSFAYGFGRTLGGPKIAPRISPSKTWAGLLGGIVGASLFIGLGAWTIARWVPEASRASHDPGGPLQVVLIGAVVAVAAQAGDFLESWLKRRAGVKDSSNLIPGHGGVFDRTDGIIPVVLLTGAAFFALLS